MGPETFVTVGHQAMEITMILMLILLVPALLVGLAVSVFQAATQINEQTLSFIPKLVVTLLVVVLGGPLILRLLTDYTLRLFDSIPSLVVG